MKLRPWKNLEKKMKCGPSIYGIGGIQIWQRRISRVPLGTQKNVYGFLHTRSFSSAAYVARIVVLCWWRPNGRPRAYARVNQLCLFSASRPFTTTPASASFFSRLPVIIGVATSRPISAAWL